jgi:hypothetical protein
VCFAVTTPAGHVAVPASKSTANSSFRKVALSREFVGIGATKDVLDAFADDPRIAVLDLRYWWYQPDGTLYAPKGGIEVAGRFNRGAFGPTTRWLYAVRVSHSIPQQGSHPVDEPAAEPGILFARSMLVCCSVSDKRDLTMQALPTHIIGPPRLYQPQPLAPTAKDASSSPGQQSPNNFVSGTWAGISVCDGRQHVESLKAREFYSRWFDPG